MNIEFSVTNQYLTRTDEQIVVADSKNYLYAKFTFTPDWDGVNKVAQFTKNGKTYDKELVDDMCLVPWEVLVGDKPIFVNVFGGDLITVNECVVRLKPSGLREGQLPAEPTPNYFDSKVNEIKGIKAETNVARDEAINAAETATQQAGIATEQAAAAQAAADAAKISEGNAKTSEINAGQSETNSEQSKIAAAQALSDLLAMLGTDIATLTDGKLTPSQIPPLSINDVFSVANTDAMLLLTAQRGDVALIVVENVVTDSYILAADDATVLDNWKKLGVSYVANAGHATTADSATNADKINNKRIVSMTQSQYDNAVLDPDTFYFVEPDGD